MLAQAGSLYQRVQEIAIQGANGTLDAQDRENLAQEVQDIKTELVRIGNTRGTRGFIFGGTLTATPPYSDAGSSPETTSSRSCKLAAARAQL